MGSDKPSRTLCNSGRAANKTHGTQHKSFPRQAYLQRSFRMRRALQCNVSCRAACQVHPAALRHTSLYVVSEMPARADAINFGTTIRGTAQPVMVSSEQSPNDGTILCKQLGRSQYESKSVHEPRSCSSELSGSMKPRSGRPMSASTSNPEHRNYQIHCSSISDAGTSASERPTILRLLASAAASNTMILGSRIFPNINAARTQTTLPLQPKQTPGQQSRVAWSDKLRPLMR